MKKLLLISAATLIVSNSTFAGGILTNTNQHAAFLRMLSRGATTEIDGALSNPAGLAFLPKDGFHVGSGMASFWAMLQGGSGPSGSVMNAGFPLSQSNIWMLLGVLALTFVAKALVTLMTIRSGASGGVLQPGIALGSTLGAMLGLVWILMFPTDSITVCALIGAASLLSASQQAPLMAMCLVMELSEAPITFFVPVGMAVATSSLISKWLLSRK